MEDGESNCNKLHFLLWCQSVRGRDYGKEGFWLVGQSSSPNTSATHCPGLQLWVWTVPARDTETVDYTQPFVTKLTIIFYFMVYEYTWNFCICNIKCIWLKRYVFIVQCVVYVSFDSCELHRNIDRNESNLLGPCLARNQACQWVLIGCKKKSV